MRVIVYDLSHWAAPMPTHHQQVASTDTPEIEHFLQHLLVLPPVIYLFL